MPATAKAKSQIKFFVVHKESLVKQKLSLEGPLTHHCRASSQRWHFHHQIKLALIDFIKASSPDIAKIVELCAGLGNSRICGRQIDLRDRGSNSFVGIESSNQFDQPSLIHNSIAVEEGDVFTRGFGKADVVTRSKTRVGRQLDNRHLREMLPHVVCASVNRCVINQYYLVSGKGLVGQ